MRILALTATDVAAWTGALVAIIGALSAGIVMVIKAIRGDPSTVQLQSQLDNAVTPRLDAQREDIRAVQAQVSAVALQTPPATQAPLADMGAKP